MLSFSSSIVRAERGNARLPQCTGNMDDQTITSSEQLQAALRKMSRPSLNEVKTEPRHDKMSPQLESTSLEPTVLASPYSTSGLLQNLCGLQTAGNRKLDMLIDSINLSNRLMEKMLAEQIKQTEVLSAVSRNTANYEPAMSTPSRASLSRSSKFAVKDYGFTNPHDVASALLLKMLKQADILIRQRGITYRSTETLTKSALAGYMKLACDNEFKTTNQHRGQIKLPENKDTATLLVASRVGSVDGTIPILTPSAMRDLMDDPECRTFMSALEIVIERLRTVRLVLPYYESDMLNALQYPFFTKEGELMCNWEHLIPRQQTEAEVTMSKLQSKSKKVYVTLVAKGSRTSSALSAAAAM